MSYQPKNWYWCKYRQRDTAKRYGQERAYTVLPSRDWKEHEMKDNIENEEGLERLGRTIVVLIAIGALAVISVGAHMLYALWKGLA